KRGTMASIMIVPGLGIVDKTSYIDCPESGARHAIFGESHVDEIAAAHGIDNVAKLPMDPAIAAACDSGDIGSIRADCLAEFAEKLAAACGA
ncbi:MAG: Mrp/NBP35 family ATP-binding protein, partial [Oscillospiraceae bacterium]|nr:Mrp/NBP35 family ATP-binding protein [Oscillospiraceae bacterium]